MSPFETIAFVAFTHFVADWIVQTNWQAQNKSKNMNALSRHVATYTMCFIPFLWLMQATPAQHAGFLALTFGTHLVTDLITSQYTSRWWFIEMRGIRTYTHDADNPTKSKEYEFVGNFDQRKRKLFFVMIGFDQFIHVLTLAGTYVFLFGAK